MRDRAYLLTLYKDDGTLCTPILHVFKRGKRSMRELEAKHRKFRDNISDMESEGTDFLLSLVLFNVGVKAKGVPQEQDPATCREEKEELIEAVDSLYNNIQDLRCVVDEFQSLVSDCENSALDLSYVR